MTDQTVSITYLRRTIMDEIYSAFGLSPQCFLHQLIDPLFWLPSDRFAHLGVRFDQVVAQLGFAEAARWVLTHFVQDMSVVGYDEIPLEGPLLITSNHPGTIDSLAITANLPRNDVKIIASGIPFIKHLPSTSQHIIYVARHNMHERMLSIRAGIRHLQEGGALLIFPSGNIDPDPAVLPGADTALTRWSPSLEIILRKAPQTRILMTIVSDVLSQSILCHPLLQLQKGFRERQKLAEFIQTMQQLVTSKNFNLTPKISFKALGEALDTQSENNSLHVMQSLINKAQELLELHLDTFKN